MWKHIILQLDEPFIGIHITKSQDSTHHFDMCCKLHNELQQISVLLYQYFAAGRLHVHETV